MSKLVTDVYYIASPNEKELFSLLSVTRNIIKKNTLNFEFWTDKLLCQENIQVSINLMVSAFAMSNVKHSEYFDA